MSQSASKVEVSQVLIYFTEYGVEYSVLCLGVAYFMAPSSIRKMGPFLTVGMEARGGKCRPSAARPESWTAESRDLQNRQGLRNHSGAGPEPTAAEDQRDSGPLPNFPIINPFATLQLYAIHFLVLPLACV